MADGEHFIKDVSFLSLWNVSSSFISIFSFYLITNILGPVEYGKYSLVISLIAIVSLSTYGAINETLLRFSAITSDKRLVKTCIKIQYALGFIALLGLLIFSYFIDNVYNKHLSVLLVIASLSFLFSPLIEVFKSLTMGRRNVNNLVYLSLSNQLLLIVLVAGFYLVSFKTALSMVIVYLFASFFNFFQARHLLNKMEYKDDGKYNKNEIVSYIKNGFLFGIFKNIFFQSALIMGSRFVDVANIGYYTFSVSIATVSIFAITGAIHILAVPYITSFYDKGKIKKVNVYFSASIKFGFVISLVVSFALYAFLKIFLEYLFPKYIPALLVLPYILIAFTLLNFNAASSFLKAKGHISLLTKIVIIASTFSLLDSYFLSRYYGFKGMLFSLIINVLFMCLLNWYYAYKKLKINFIILPTKAEISAFKFYLDLFLGKIIKKFR